MKTITKLSFVAATVAAIATNAALADDQQLQKQLALVRAQSAQSSRMTTVAVYANDRGVGSRASQEARSESRFELRSNAHGQTYGFYVPVK